MRLLRVGAALEESLNLHKMANGLLRCSPFSFYDLYLFFVPKKCHIKRITLKSFKEEPFKNFMATTIP